MIETAQEITDPAEQNKYKIRADKLRKQLLEKCLDSDTVEIENTLAYCVSQYTDPEKEMAKLSAMPREDAAQEEAAKREFFALSRLIESQNKTVMKFGSDESAGLTLAVLNKCTSIDACILVDEIREQAKRLTSDDQDAIKELMAQQAILSHHVGQHIIQKSVNAPTTEAQAVVASHGVRVLESSARIAERLAKISQPKLGNVYANQANIAHNQVVQNGLPVESVDALSEKIRADNQLLECNDGTRSNLSRLDTGKETETVRSDKKMEAMGKINGTQK